MSWTSLPQYGNHGEMSPHSRRARRAGIRLSVLIAAVALSAALFLTAVFLGGCSKKSGDSQESSRPPILLIGLDGVEWNVVKPLVDAGKLPVMADLMNRGSYGYIESMRPTYSPLIWTTIATGKTPNKHGITHFVYEVFEDGVKQRRYFTSGHRKTKAFWNILSDYGQTVHTIGWWMTYPVEHVNGIMVSQTNTADVLRDPKDALWKGSLVKGVEDQVYPMDRQNRVMDIFAAVDDSLREIAEGIFGKKPHPLNDFSRLMWTNTDWAVRADVTYERVAKDILSEKKPFDL
ncbi:MAG: alkaline phosphatase family protein, partial [bacterium]